MDYKELIENPNFSSPAKVADWIGNATCAITDLLARAETAEARCSELEAKCKRLDESRERANESAHMWESRCKMLEEQKAAPEEVIEAIDGLIEFARERMSITDWLYYVNVIGPWRGEEE